MILRLIILLLLTSLECLGNDCTDFSLYSESRSPLKKMDIYNQGELNICYAIAASDLINYELIETGQRIHPLLVAIEYAKNKMKKQLDIGTTRDAIRLMETPPNCEHDLVENKLILELGKHYYTKISRLLKSSSSSTELVQKLSSLIPPKCFSNREKKLKIDVQRYNFNVLANDESYENFLLQKLVERKKPISITYCSNIWKDIKYDGIDLTKMGLRDKLKKDCHYHESLIVGKKMIGEQCHFLVRNSWGSKWSKDNSKYLCTCRIKGADKIIDDCNSKDHHDAEVLACWLPSNALSRNIGALTLIQDITRIINSSPPLPNSLSKSSPP